MKVYSIILFKNGEIFNNQNEVSQFGYFQRSSITEMLVFISKLVLSKTPINKRQTIQHKEFNVHCYKVNNAGSVIITDLEYPERPIYALMYKMLTEDFIPDIKDTQNPINYDKISLVKEQLEDTISVMHETIDKVLERGVKIDHLVEKSEDLSIQSKMFYKQSKKYNQCCSIS